MIIIVLLLIHFMVTPIEANDYAFYDDFSYGDISDWDVRCLPGSW